MTENSTPEWYNGPDLTSPINTHIRITWRRSLRTGGHYLEIKIYSLRRVFIYSQYILDRVMDFTLLLREWMVTDG